MSERNLYGEPQRSIAGQIFGLTGHTRTYTAGEKIFPGDPVFGMVGDGKYCYRAHINAVTISADANFVAGNNLALIVNGIALPSIPFLESSTKTLENLVKEINLNGSLSELCISAFVVEGANAITLVSPGVSVVASLTVTDGASQPSINIAADTNLKFIGVAQHTELSSKDGTGFYAPEDLVNVYDFGEIYVPVAEDSYPSDKEQAYINIAGGNFTDVSSGNYDCGCYFRSEKQDGLARIEVRGMK